MNTTVLQLEKVHKTIKSKPIVKDLNLTIESGQIYGFLGPNGAGKSTTLKLIVGLLKPSSGRILICGHSIQHAFVDAMKQIGCLIETPDFYENISGYKNLEMLSSMSDRISHDAIMRTVAQVGLEHRIHDKVSTYSLGMKQRLGLAQAFMHRPQLLVLDEPMNGLDPHGIFTFRNILRDMTHKHHVAALVSSHLISEIQLLCDRVAIIKDGMIIRDSTVSDLIPSGSVFWEIDRTEAAQSFLSSEFSIHSVVVGPQLHAVIDSSELPEINAALINEGFRLKYIHTHEPTLESLFLDLTGNQQIK